jgi:hypothetical protein
MNGFSRQNESPSCHRFSNRRCFSPHPTRNNPTRNNPTRNNPTRNNPTRHPSCRRAGRFLYALHTASIRPLAGALGY